MNTLESEVVCAVLLQAVYALNIVSIVDMLVKLEKLKPECMQEVVNKPPNMMRVTFLSIAPRLVDFESFMLTLWSTGHREIHDKIINTLHPPNGDSQRTMEVPRAVAKVSKKSLSNFNKHEREFLNGGKVPSIDFDSFGQMYDRNEVDNCIATLTSSLDAMTVFTQTPNVCAKVFDFFNSILSRSSNEDYSSVFYFSRLALRNDIEYYFMDSQKYVKSKSQEDGSNALHMAHMYASNLSPNMATSTLLAIDVYHQLWLFELNPCNERLKDMYKTLLCGFKHLDLMEADEEDKDLWKRIMICKLTLGLLGISNGIYLINGFTPTLDNTQQAALLLDFFECHLRSTPVEKRVLMLYNICRSRLCELQNDRTGAALYAFHARESGESGKFRENENVKEFQLRFPKHVDSKTHLLHNIPTYSLVCQPSSQYSACSTQIGSDNFMSITCNCDICIADDINSKTIQHISHKCQQPCQTSKTLAHAQPQISDHHVIISEHSSHVLPTEYICVDDEQTPIKEIFGENSQPFHFAVNVENRSDHWSENHVTGDSDLSTNYNYITFSSGPCLQHSELIGLPLHRSESDCSIKSEMMLHRSESDCSIKSEMMFGSGVGSYESQQPEE